LCPYQDDEGELLAPPKGDTLAKPTPAKRNRALPKTSPQTDKSCVKQVAAMSGALKDIAEAKQIIALAQSPTFEASLKESAVAIIIGKIRKRAEQSQISIYCADRPGTFGELDGQRFNHDELANKGIEIVEQLEDVQARLQLVHALVKAFFAPGKKSKDPAPTSDTLAEAIGNAEASGLRVPSIVRESLFTRSTKELFEKGDFAMLAKLLAVSNPCQEPYVTERGLSSLTLPCEGSVSLQTKSIMAFLMDIFRADKTKDRLTSFAQELRKIDIKDQSLETAIAALTVVTVLALDTEDAQQALAKAKTTLSSKDGKLYKALHVLPLGRAIMGEVAQILVKFESDQSFEEQLAPLFDRISEGAKVTHSGCEVDYNRMLGLAQDSPP
jgi:hypothetical protein